MASFPQKMFTFWLIQYFILRVWTLVTHNGMDISEIIPLLVTHSTFVVYRACWRRLNHSGINHRTGNRNLVWLQVFHFGFAAWDSSSGFDRCGSVEILLRVPVAPGLLPLLNGHLHHQWALHLVHAWQEQLGGENESVDHQFFCNCNWSFVTDP